MSTTPFSWRGWDERSALWPVARATPGCSNATGRCSVCRSILLWSGGWEGVVSVDAMREGALAAIPRITLTREDAAAALGMSLDSFERYVQPHLRLLRLGRMVLVPVGELRRWADDVAERAV